MERTAEGSPGRLFPAVALLGFASGLPLLLTGSTLQAWMKSAGVDLALIGAFALTGLPYTLKFLWSPLVDRWPIPPGARRGWILLGQGSLCLLLLLMALQDPGKGLFPLALLATGIAFASATQDIAVDAWRTELLPAQWQGLGASLHIGAYRLGMLVAGALALVLADHLSWRQVYLLMAVLVLPGMLAASAGPENPPASRPVDLGEAVLRPLRGLLGTGAGLSVLLLVGIYKLGDSLGLALVVPFLQEQGFTLTEVGLATKGVGLGALILGSLAGGWLLIRWPLRRALLVFGVAQALPCLALFALSLSGRDLPLMLAAVALENLGYGLGSVALTTLMMRLCQPGLAATQYALLSSLSALTRVVLAAPAGLLASRLGWPAFFLCCSCLALPGLALVRLLRGLDRMGEDA